MNPTPKPRLIEIDDFPFEFLSRIAERESWRKEIHRPIYHVHKWWAKRLGSVFRGILLGSILDKDSDVKKCFYEYHSFSRITVFDPFMGSGTTIGEAHKLGFTALGRDINPVAVETVRSALGPMELRHIQDAFHSISSEVEERLRALYTAGDSQGNTCDVLYHFWVMQAECPACAGDVDLFSTYVFGQNAYPHRKPEVQVLCPNCGDVFQGQYGQNNVTCPTCSVSFNPLQGPAKGQNAICPHCSHGPFSILKTIGKRKKRPAYRLYAKLVLRQDGEKEYLCSTRDDILAVSKASDKLKKAIEAGEIVLPDLALEPGYNTNQAISYNFINWRHFFLDRQLLALGWLRAAIMKSDHVPTRDLMLTLFSGLLEFNNLFTSYKGEGTGAVRHMFSHHILKPERMPIEANVWGTPKSSGSFTGLFRNRLMRAIGYRSKPTEVNGSDTEKGLVCSPEFTGRVENWPRDSSFTTRGVYLSCGDSAKTELPSRSIDLVITDPPFFDNVHYSQLADFFHAWREIDATKTTRHDSEVQDTDPNSFAQKLQNVFKECNRLLKDNGLLVFTYHHSRDEGWHAVAQAIYGSGFRVVNSQPIKAELSVAMPKHVAKEPIQLDIILVCRKADIEIPCNSVKEALESSYKKIKRFSQAGFTLSRNDQKIILFGQLLTTMQTHEDAERVGNTVHEELAKLNLEGLAEGTAILQQQAV